MTEAATTGTGTQEAGAGATAEATKNEADVLASAVRTGAAREGHLWVFRLVGRILRARSKAVSPLGTPAGASRHIATFCSEVPGEPHDMDPKTAELLLAGESFTVENLLKDVDQAMSDWADQGAPLVVLDTKAELERPGAQGWFASFLDCVRDYVRREKGCGDDECLYPDCLKSGCSGPEAKDNLRERDRIVAAEEAREAGQKLVEDAYVRVPAGLVSWRQLEAAVHQLGGPNAPGFSILFPQGLAHEAERIALDQRLVAGLREPLTPEEAAARQAERARDAFHAASGHGGASWAQGPMGDFPDHGTLSSCLGAPPERFGCPPKPHKPYKPLASTSVLRAVSKMLGTLAEEMEAPRVHTLGPIVEHGDELVARHPGRRRDLSVVGAGPGPAEGLGILPESEIVAKETGFNKGQG